MSWQKTVIGTILVNPAAYLEATQLRKQDFDIGLQVIWETITKMYDQGVLSTQMVLETLREENLLNSLVEENVRGEEYLTRLAAYEDEKGFSLAVEKVLHAGIGKQLESFAPLVAGQIRNGTNPIEAIDDMIERLSDARRVSSNDVVYLGSLIPGFLERTTKLRAGEKVEGWHPRSVVNEIVGNVADSDFIIIAGKSGGGKSSLLRYEALKTALEGETVLTFNGENDPEWYLQYALALLSGVDDMKIRNPMRMNEKEWDKFCEAEEKLKEIPWIISPMKSINDMTFSCMQLAYKNRPSLIQIDQIQNLAEGSDFEKLESITYGLRNMAMKVGIPIMAAHQHNRSVGNQKDKRPDQHNLLYAGEHAGKQIWNLWQMDMEKDDAVRFKENRTPDGMHLLPSKDDWGVHLMRIVVSKNSSGRTGVSSEIAWYRGLNDFRPLPPDWRVEHRFAVSTLKANGQKAGKFGT